jgi:hypothetical protein
VEDSALPEGTTGGPRHRSSLWKSFWSDGVCQESSSYDNSLRTFLSYFLNFYAVYHRENVMATHPELKYTFEWSLRTRYPWNRHGISYGQARYSTDEDVHLMMNSKFASELNLGTARWHHLNHDPVLNITAGHEPVPFKVVWYDPTIPAVPPTDTGSKAYINNMVFQRNYADQLTPQLVLWGRQESWAPADAHRKDDSTGIFLSAFGERFLTNTDEPADWLRSNAEAMNVILVDDSTAGPVNTRIPSGPTRSTIATIKQSLVSPYVDYGMMASQLNSVNDVSYYKDRAQLDRHVFFPDHRFWIVVDDMKAPDGNTHTYGWTGHCVGSLDLTVPQQATFTKASGRKLDIHFFGTPVTFQNYSIPVELDWQTPEVEAPYFIANSNGHGTQYLTALFPMDIGETAPTYEQISVTRGSAGKVIIGNDVYLAFCQPGTTENVTVDGKLQTNATAALAKITGGTVEYILFIGQQGLLQWNGQTLIGLDNIGSYLYLPVDPETGGPSLTPVRQAQ